MAESKDSKKMRLQKEIRKDAVNGPIGIFDSGIGGLTVAREIMNLIPYEDIIYFGDTARVPYGSKSKEMITRFSMEIVEFLLKKKVNLVVVACNTASSCSLLSLRREFSIPIIGVVKPGIQKALEVTRNGRIGIIGTEGTIRSRTYEKIIHKQNNRVKTYSQACPLFVPLVEEGWFDGPITAEIVKHYLAPLKKAKVDTVILGCTHYPLLKEVIKKVMGPTVKLIDSAFAVATLVRESLAYRKARKRDVVFYVSDEPGKFIQAGEKFIGKKIENVHWVRL